MALYAPEHPRDMCFIPDARLSVLRMKCGQYHTSDNFLDNTYLILVDINNGSALIDLVSAVVIFAEISYHDEVQIPENNVLSSVAYLDPSLVLQLEHGLQIGASTSTILFHLESVVFRLLKQSVLPELQGALNLQQ